MKDKTVQIEKRNPWRPTKYKPEFVGEVDKYLETTSRDNTKLPTMQGFALWLDVSGDTLVEWAKKYEDFSASIKKLMLKQAEQLINDGIYGGKEVNATIVKLLLQNNHGMKERIDATSQGEKLEGLVVIKDYEDKTIEVAD